MAAATEHEDLLRHLDLRCVVDVGANRGQFTLVVRALFPEATVFAFEPLDGPASVFERLFEGSTRVSLRRCALGAETATRTMYVSRRDDSSSLLAIEGAQAAVFPGTQAVGERVVSVVSLAKALAEAQIDSPALLKLDVQGYELEVLKGATPLLETFEWVYAECSFIELYRGQAMAGDVIAFLAAFGFGIDGVYNVANDRHGRAVQSDIVFRRRQ